MTLVKRVMASIAALCLMSGLSQAAEMSWSQVGLSENPIGKVYFTEGLVCDTADQIKAAVDLIDLGGYAVREALDEINANTEPVRCVINMRFWVRVTSVHERIDTPELDHAIIEFDVIAVGRAIPGTDNAHVPQLVPPVRQFGLLTRRSVVA